MYNERVERHKYLFSYHILNRSVPKSSLYLGLVITREKKNENQRSTQMHPACVLMLLLQLSTALSNTTSARRRRFAGIEQAPA